MRNTGSGVRLVVQSWRVLRRNPALLALPVLAALTSAAVLAVIALGVWYTVLHQGRAEELVHLELSLSTLLEHHLTHLAVPVTYLVVAYVATFYTTALVAGTLEAFEGREASLGWCLKEAWKRKVALGRLALLQATVGVVLRTFERRSRWARRTALRVAGMMWGAASLTAIPTLVVEGGSARDTMRRSGSLVRRRWGSAAVGAVGVPLVALALVWLVAVPVVAVVLQASEVGALVATALAVVLFLTLRSALGGVFSTALYHYAARGRVPTGFDVRDLQGAVESEALPRSGSRPQQETGWEREAAERLRSRR